MSICKATILRELLGKQSSVFIHFDPRASDVVVPEYLKRNYQCVLQYGYNQPVPVLDFDIIPDREFRGVFSFKGRRELCIVPLRTVFCVVGADSVDGGVIFNHSLPVEVVELMVAAKKGVAAEHKTVVEPKEAPKTNVFSLADARRRKLERGPHSA